MLKLFTYCICYLCLLSGVSRLALTCQYGIAHNMLFSSDYKRNWTYLYIFRSNMDTYVDCVEKWKHFDGWQNENLTNLITNLNQAGCLAWTERVILAV